MWVSYTCAMLVALIAAAGCGAGRAGFAVALGSHGALPTWQGSCLADSARGDAIAIDGESFDARAVGRTTLTCARGALDIDVLGVDRIEIDGPDSVGGHTVYFRVRAFGDGRELDLGEGFAVSWTHDASLVRDSACSDGLGTCAGSDSIRVHATSTGRGRISVSLAGRTATRAVTLTAR